MPQLVSCKVVSDGIAHQHTGYVAQCFRRSVAGESVGELKKEKIIVPNPSLPRRPPKPRLIMRCGNVIFMVVGRVKECYVLSGVGDHYMCGCRCVDTTEIYIAMPVCCPCNTRRHVFGCLALRNDSCPEGGNCCTIIASQCTQNGCCELGAVLLMLYYNIYAKLGPFQTSVFD